MVEKSLDDVLKDALKIKSEQEENKATEETSVPEEKKEQVVKEKKEETEELPSETKDASLEQSTFGEGE